MAQLHYHETAKPVVACLVGFHLNVALALKQDKGSAASAPRLVLDGGAEVRGDVAIARYLARTAGGAMLGGEDTLAAAEVDTFVDLAVGARGGGAAGLAAVLDKVLAGRTFLAGFLPSVADAACFGVLIEASFDTAGAPNVARWMELCNARIQGKRVQGILRLRAPAAAGAAGAGGKAGAGAGGKAGKKAGSKKGGDGKKSGSGSKKGAVGGTGGMPELPGAVEGEVVTRFPPEPSGFLHIGHAKALFLNNYFARHYKGKLVVRFDDTNPSKEKEEYEESIIRDLGNLDILPDQITHTSDLFPTIIEYAHKMIKSGHAFMDDTEQKQMQSERMDGIDSPRRNESVEDNLARFDLMLTGGEGGDKWCMRAKMGMTNPNKAMRDPVMFRANAEPHARTGTTYKAYPTYDFACPIVDALEGITHALRTTEYRDRRPQYYWIQEHLGLRHVEVLEFSRLNFIYTVLSKRSLAWFVDEGHVDGWTDPRFPTIQGMLRRGMTVEGLRAFILEQGFSKRVIDMEWDKFWVGNSRIHDNNARRACALEHATRVPFDLSNGPEEPAGRSTNAHPKRPELGSRIIMTAKRVFVEGSDAQELKEGEEVVLTRWDTAIVEKITKDKEGNVVALAGKMAPGGNYRKSKKLSWLADVEDNVPARLCEFDFLISKKSLDEGESFRDFIRPVSKAETLALGDQSLRTVQKDEVIQLERRGFFRCDRPYGGPEEPIVLFMIPDGKQRMVSAVGSKLAHR